MSSESSPTRGRVGIATLPVEMLRHIIAFAAANDPPKYLYEGPYITAPEDPCYMGWIPITHVCRLWREVALTTKSLWTDIILNMGQGWVNEMIRRSGPTSAISIVATDCEGWDGDMYDMFDAIVPPVMDRVERLELLGDLSELGYACSQLRSATTPALKSLCLVKTPCMDADADVDLEGLFACHTPRLSTLRLHDIGLPGTSFYMFGNLKHFEIYHSGGNWRMIHAYPAELLKALAHMPLLEVLSMTGYVLSDLIPSQQSVTVNLHNLRTLTMEGDRHVLDYMRRHIVLPASCVVSEKYDDDE